MLKYDIYSLTNFGIWLRDATVSYNYFIFLYLFLPVFHAMNHDWFASTHHCQRCLHDALVHCPFVHQHWWLAEIIHHICQSHSFSLQTIPSPVFTILFYLNSQKEKKKKSTTQIIMEYNILINVCVQYLLNLLQIIADYLLCSYNAWTQLLNAVL